MTRQATSGDGKAAPARPLRPPLAAASF